MYSECCHYCWTNMVALHASPLSFHNIFLWLRYGLNGQVTSDFMYQHYDKSGVHNWTHDWVHMHLRRILEVCTADCTWAPVMITLPPVVLYGPDLHFLRYNFPTMAHADWTERRSKGTAASLLLTCTGILTEGDNKDCIKCRGNARCWAQNMVAGL